MKKEIFLKKRNIFFIAIGVVILGFALFFSCGGWDYVWGGDQEENREQLTMAELKKKDGLSRTAQAASGLPWQFGGTVIKYQPACVLDNPGGTCELSCFNCSKMVGQKCNLYQEIVYAPALGSDPTVPPGTVCVPVETAASTYKGGIPSPGAQILGGGAAPISPWVIGVSP